ncbi:MAG: hypothetical protein PT977_04915 [Acidobacteriota bacterium]|nr:hypothetical protein [Acidobacteriota bacterium]
METYSPTSQFGKSPVVGAAQKLGSEIKSEFKNDASGLADRAGEAAKTLGEHASSALGDLKSAGQGIVDEYGDKLAKGKKRLDEAAERVSKYADNNTALVAGGSLVLGILLGHLLTRRSN